MIKTEQHPHMWPWTAKPVISSTGIFVAIAKNTLYGSKLSIFLLCQLIIRIIKFMFHEDIFCKFPTVNIPKHHFWLVICIAMNLIWTTLKAIFSIFRFFAPSDSRVLNSCISAKYCPILTNHTSMESLFIQLSDDVKSQFNFFFIIINPYDWFCGPGSHIRMISEG